MAGKKGHGRPKTKPRLRSELRGGNAGISKRIREMRTRLNLKQTQLAERLDVAGNAVSLWERGKLPTIENLRRLAELGRVTLDWLVEGHETFEGKLLQLSEEELRGLEAYVNTVLSAREKNTTKSNTNKSPEE
jgi:transcriptional regulator with XRE-family HTH domain